MRLIPTPVAKIYSREISGALDAVQRASTAVVTNPLAGTLSLAILPTFGTRWLAPRLGDFMRANPGIHVNLATRVQRFSFEAEPFDAVIYFGSADWPATCQFKLFDECYTACASPQFLRDNPVSAPKDVKALPLLMLETRPDAWNSWFEAHGESPMRTSGMLMDQFSMMIQAAISGLGIGLLPHYLAETEIEEGRLAPIFNPEVSGVGSYWLAWPTEKDQDGPLRVFRNWVSKAKER